MCHEHIHRIVKISSVLEDFGNIQHMCALILQTNAKLLHVIKSPFYSEDSTFMTCHGVAILLQKRIGILNEIIFQI